MEKLKSSLRNMLLSLTAICLFAGGILATVSRYTAEPIAAAKAAALNQAIRAVVPSFDNNPLADSYKEPTSDGDSLILYPATLNGKEVGVAVESSSKNGFSGLIRVIVGFDMEGKIVNYSVLEHAETPGLGSKMQDWFRTDKNKQSVIGRSLTKGNLSVVQDGGDVDAITASTITSRAFLNSINRAYSAFMKSDATTGATPSNNTEADATTGATETENTENKEEEGGSDE